MAADGQRTARSKPGPLIRVFRAWRVIAPEQRVCALAAFSLWITMFLPWYSETGIAVSKSSQAVSITLTAWGAFSFVELAVLLISVAVVALLFARGERRAFHLPGGDGTVILLAGGWAAVLIFYRMLDKQGATNSKTAVLTSGIQWGIFLALFAAIWLAWTGLRIRRSHRAEPALADDPTVHLQARAPTRRERDDEPAAVPATVRSARPEDLPREDDLEREHRGVTREDAEQLSFELPRELRND
jgi:type VI protein secretion system component VasK